MKVAITGQICAGKTELAKALVRNYGCVIAPMSAALKREAMERGWEGEKWDGKKDEKGRLLLQRLGAGRRREDEDYWVKRWAEIQPENPVVDDLRHLNEARFLMKEGCLLVGVITPEHVRRERHDKLYGAVSHERWAEMHAHESEIFVPQIIELFQLPVVSGTADPDITARYVAELYYKTQKLQKLAA